MKNEIKAILKDAVEWIAIAAALTLFLVAIGKGPWTRWAEPAALLAPFHLALRSYRRIKATDEELGRRAARSRSPIGGLETDQLLKGIPMSQNIRAAIWELAMWVVVVSAYLGVRAALDKSWRELIPTFAIVGPAIIATNAYRRAKAAKSTPDSKGA